MKRAGVDEEDAFSWLRKLAIDQNRKLVEIAEIVLTAEKSLDAPVKS